MIAKINLDGKERLAVVFEPLPITSYDDVIELRECLISLLAVTPSDFLTNDAIAPVLNFVSTLNGTKQQAFTMAATYFDTRKQTEKPTVKDCKITF